MNKIMFNERYGLQSAVFDGIKTQTRREPFYSNEKITVGIWNGKLAVYVNNIQQMIHVSRFAFGEEVAVAQSYKEIGLDPNQCVGTIDYGGNMYMPLCAGESKGWNNKMFVLADEMPHHIKILDIRCERLQDISAMDCISEGIKCYYEPKNDWFNRPNEKQSSFSFLDKSKELFFFSAKEAFCGLIGKLNGKKFWDTNPYVIVYEFEKID